METYDEESLHLLSAGRRHGFGGVVAVRSRFLGDEGQKPLDRFIADIKKEIADKAIRRVETKQE